jgi:ABC-type dipeptide/oligopeptide/nickel transport system ATPase component
VTSTRTQPAAPETQRSRPLLEIDDLAVSFDAEAGQHVEAVDGMMLTIHPTQTLAIVGESGCGKSVTAMSVLRLVPTPPGRYDRGSIRFEGRDLLKLGEREMLDVRGGQIAMIFQEPLSSLNPVYSVGDQIVEAIRLHQSVDRKQARELAAEAMLEVGIPDGRARLDAYPHEFSGGMCQRVMAAMALSCKPKLLLADEPTTALDVTIQAQILQLLRDLQCASDMAMMLITHDLCVVAEHADVVCVMYAGRVVEYARVFDLFDTPHHPYSRGLLAALPRLRERRTRLRTVSDLVADPDEFRRLPGHKYGIVPWWPHMDPPSDLVPAQSPETGRDHVLLEIEPDHWVACWRTEYLHDHPTRPPDTSFRRIDVRQE